MPATTGRFTEGKLKGWRWQLYPDDSSPSGWVRKFWNPLDTSNGGKPTEHFSNYDYQADVEDEQAAGRKIAGVAARKAEAEGRYQAKEDAAIERNKQYWASQNVQRDKEYGDRQQQLKAAVREQRRQFDLGYGLDQRRADLDDRRLVSDDLKTGASLRGANDLVQGWGYAQGVQNAGLSPYAQAIRGGTAVNYGGGTATQGHPVPLTVGSLAAEMGGGGASGGGGGTGTDQYGRPILSAERQGFVDDVGRAFEGGLANKPQGYLENMTTGQRQGFMSAGAWLGRDTDAEQTYYKRSRPGQGSFSRA